MMTLDECKQRALEYLDRGDLVNAVASMGSDYKSIKKPDPFLMMVGMMAAGRADRDAVRRWIEGFN
jgi:hypothetical protein